MHSHGGKEDGYRVQSTESILSRQAKAFLAFVNEIMKRRAHHFGGGGTGRSTLKASNLRRWDQLESLILMQS